MTRIKRRRAWLAPAFVAAATFLAFLPILTNQFVTWDDDRNFLDNPAYRGLGPSQLHWMWTTFHMGHYVPLSWMTLGLDYEIWGMDGRGYHLTNLLIHTANAVLLYFIARRMLLAAHPESPPNGKGAPAVAISLAAAIGVLLFTVHPLRVESVAWATERRDVLSGLLVSASLLCYLRYTDDTAGRKWYWWSLAIFVAALLSKATAVTLPAVLLILNLYPLRRIPSLEDWWSVAARRVYKEIVPFAVLGAATAPLTIVALAPPKQLTFGAKVAVSTYSLMFYVWKTVVPLALSPLYAMPHHIDPAEPRFLLSYAFVIAVALVAVLAYRRFPAVTIAIAVFFVIILPMLGVVQNGPQIAADRYTYHASAALTFLLAGALLGPLAGSASRAVVGTAALAIAALGALTWRQTHVWHDPERFWTYVHNYDTTSAIAETALGTLHLSRNELDSAITHYTKALHYDSSYVEVEDNLGVALSRLGRYREAIPHFQRALYLNPRNHESHNNLGVAEAKLGDYNSAIEEYAEAIETDPNYADAEVNWGNALVRMNRVSEALGHYAAAVRINPGNAEAHTNWGVALALSGRYGEAIDQFNSALAIKPEDAETKSYLSKAIELQAQPPGGGR